MPNYILDSLNLYHQGAVAPLADKFNAKSFTLLTTNWQTDGSADYPYYYDFAVQGMTANDIISCSINLANRTAAKVLYTRLNTLAGKIRFRAKEIPAANISGYYWFEGNIKEA